MDVVTGATGFVGPHLVDGLLARGRHVRCLVRDLARASTLERPGVEVRQGSLLDDGFVADALRGAERVFHLAGGGKVSTASQAGLGALRAANVAPLETVIRCARAAKVTRFVHFSSISSMGVKLDVVLDESSPCAPETPHEVAKYESERVVLDAFRRDGTPVVVLRPSQIYGPGDVRSEIPKLVSLARRGLVPLFGGGQGLMPWVFVSDVVDAALAAGERPEALGQIYIVSDSESYRFADIVAAIARALGRRRGGVVIPEGVAWRAIGAVEGVAKMFGREPPFTRHRLASMCGRRQVSIERARRDLGFVPRVGLEDGVGRTVRWCIARGLA
jgi:nucleoside-diphosphate-sugar epimerase